MASKFFKLNDKRWINRTLVCEVILAGGNNKWQVTYYFQVMSEDNEQLETTTHHDTEEDARLELERFIQGGIS